MESLTTNVTGEISAFYHFSFVHWYVPRSSFLLNRVPGSECTGCNTAKLKLLNKFSKGLLKNLENSYKSSVMEFLFSKLQA